MASLVLIPLFSYAGGALSGAAAGSAAFALGSALGAAAGAVAGAYIDNTYIYPALQGSKDSRGPRLDDLPVQTASEGSPMNYVVGNTIRVAGTLIWLSPLIEEKRETEVEGGKGGGGGAKQTTYDYYYHCAIGVCEGEIEDVTKIWADSKVIYDASLPEPKDKRAHLIRIYKGTASQAPDSIISSYMGADNTPGFRDTAYVVIEGLLLRDFGNRLPQFTFLVKAQEHESVAGALFNLTQRGNIAAEETDFEYVAKSTRGYQVTGPTDIIKSIEPLMQAYDVLVQETNGVLRFFTRGYETSTAIDPNDLCAVDGVTDASNAPPRPFTLTDPSGYNLPREVNVRFIDPTVDYQAGSARYSRNDSRTTHVEQLDLPIVMHPADAANLAALRLWRSYAERMQVSFSLPPKYFVLQENDLVTIPWAGEVFVVRLTKVVIGNNHLVQCEGVLVDTLSADEAAECALRLNPAEDVSAPLPLRAALLDVPALTDDDTERSGFYLAAVAPSGQGNFSGATVYQSLDEANWTAVGGLAAQATMGQALTVLADGDYGLVDYENTVDVMVQQGTLSSATEAQMLEGANRAWVGNELIGFTTATALTASTYRLSGLLRGLRVTPVTGHAAGDRFLLLSPVSTAFQSLPLGAVGSTRYYKVVQDGQDLDDATTDTLVFTGATLKQLPPCHLAAARSADVVLTWARRTRSMVRAFSPYKPLGADAERYEIDVFTGPSAPAPGTLPVRTLTATTPTVTYSAAQQTADGTSASALYFVVYQLNEKVGRGFPAGLAVA